MTRDAATHLASNTPEQILLNMHRTQLQSAGFCTRRSGLRGSRRGISVIEVLTSILVAAIGVAGVMVIIPFAVGQAEQGFDQETATTFGRNFADEFELRGFDQASRWVPDISSVDIGNGVVVDPIGMSATPPSMVFPYFPNDPGVQINRVSVLKVPGAPKIPANALETSLSRTLFSWRNDLVFGQPDAVNTAAANPPYAPYVSPDLAPPEMFYDFSGGTRLRRQFEGEMTCVVFCVPDQIVGLPTNPFVPAWRSHIVVYRRRPLPTASGPFPFDRVYQIDLNPQSTLVAGGEVNLTAVTVDSSQHSTIRRGDWMLLTNRPSGGIRQLNFYRVLDAAETGNGKWQVTLQGPDFSLGSSGLVSYAVHLPDVWAVIERTYEQN